MVKLLNRFARDESGATAIEYGLIAVIISLAAIGAFTTVGTNIGIIMTNVSSYI